MIGRLFKPSVVILFVANLANNAVDSQDKLSLIESSVTIEPDGSIWTNSGSLSRTKRCMFCCNGECNDDGNSGISGSGRSGIFMNNQCVACCNGECKSAKGKFDYSVSNN